MSGNNGKRTANGPMAFLLGPTAVGKTSVAIELAERHDWVILSLDSRQIYKRLEIGTAKPTEDERARARHEFLDVLEPTEFCSAVRFQRLYLAALADLDREGKSCLAVGGAGFYWEACTRGLHDLPSASPEIRAEREQILAAEGVAGLYRRLQEIDPEAAESLSPHDRQRIGRALEINRLTGKNLAEAMTGGRANESLPKAPVVVLLRPRDELYARIDQRCRTMLDEGLLDEIRGLLDSGIDPDAPGFRTVGYREFLPHLLEGSPLEPAIETFMRNSRRYAKRQQTWFRNRVPERAEIWIEEGEDVSKTADRVEEVLRLIVKGLDLDRPSDPH